MLPPFGTLGEASFRDLTRLTLILLALSTSEGVSGLRGFQLTWVSANVGFRGGHAVLAYLLGFSARCDFLDTDLPMSVMVLLLKLCQDRRRRESSGLMEL